MPNKFLRSELEQLRVQREEKHQKYKKAAAETGEACGQSAESWHDNFPFEQAMRDMQMCGQLVRELDQILADVQVVEPPTSAETVQIGTVVQVLSLDTDEYTWYRIGGYRVFGEDGLDGSAVERALLISYASPLGELLMGVKQFTTLPLRVPDRTEPELLIVIDIALPPSD